MHSPASNPGRNRAPSLKGLLAMMAGFFIVFIILAELASATTNDQPASSTTADSTVVAAREPEPVSAPAEVSPEPTSAPIKTPRSLSYGANEIIKMYKGGVKTDVLFSYIQTATLSYQLSSHEILYLSQIGMPSELVTAMIQHDHQTAIAQTNARQQAAETPVAAEQPTTSPVVYSQPVVVVQQQPKVKYVSAPVCSAPVCSTVSQAGPNVTIIGSRYGSTFYNGCYYGPFSYSPARAYFNSAFGPQCSSIYEFGYRNRFAYNGYGYGGYGFGRHHGRF